MHLHTHLHTYLSEYYIIVSYCIIRTHVVSFLLARKKKIIDDHKTHLDFKITCKIKVLIDEDSWKWQIPTSLFFFSFCFIILFWNGSKLDWFSSPPRKQKSINLFSDTFVPRWEGLNPYWITCTQSDRV